MKNEPDILYSLSSSDLEFEFFCGNCGHLNCYPLVTHFNNRNFLIANKFYKCTACKNFNKLKPIENPAGLPNIKMECKVVKNLVCIFKVGDIVCYQNNVYSIQEITPTIDNSMKFIFVLKDIFTHDFEYVETFEDDLEWLDDVIKKI